MSELYNHTEDVHNLTAPREVVPIIIDLVKPQSVLDVGCGIGTWLKAFEENGVHDYVGIDGTYVNRGLLKIPASKFLEADLTSNWAISRKFDLVLCLEVAEHIPEICADEFVESLLKYADTIIFSAAIPGQGGQNHLNEQWPSYWQEKFASHGFYFHDIIRPMIWNNRNIDWWYKQNIFLLKKEQSSSEILNCYHPDCFKEHIDRLKLINESARLGKLGIRESFKILVRSIHQMV